MRGCCAKRTILEKILIMVVVLLVCLFVGLFAVFLSYVMGDRDEHLAHLNQESSKEQPLESNVCVSRKCIQAAAQVLDFVDPSVEPCDDFYKFVCGTFFEKAKNQITPLSNLEELTMHQIDSLITEPITGQVPKSWQLQRQYYKKCMNTGAIDDDHNETFLNLIRKLGDWPVFRGRFWNERQFHWLSSIINCRRLGFGYDNFLKFSTITIDNTTNILLSISPPDIINIAYQYKEAYVDLMTNISIVLGAPSYVAKSEFPRVLHFEEEIKSYVLDEENNGHETVVNISTLQQQFPSIPWLKFLNNLTQTATFDESSVVYFKANRYLENLQKLLSSTSATIQANYVVWKIVENFRNYLNESVRTLYDAFLIGVNPNLAFTTNRHRYCLTNAKTYFPLVAETAYVRRHLEPRKRDNIKQMCGRVKQVLLEKLKKNEWLDNRSKVWSVNRLYQIEELIGVSDSAYNEDFDKVVDMDGFNPKTDNIIEMVTQLRVLRSDNYFKVVGQKSSEVTKLFLNKSPILHINAFYADAFNVLVLAAPFLQGVIYEFERPQYMNYGALGTVIGHELTHSFMDQDKTQWSPETIQIYNEKIQCLLDEYDNYTDHRDEFTRDAKSALQENLADLIGPNLAYEAYQQWLRDHHEESSLVGLNYTSNQMFWIMSAAYKCYQPNSRWNLNFDQKHGVPSFAVSFSKKHSPAFAADFNCPTETNMNPKKKCQIL